MFFQIAVLINLAELTGKHLCRSHFSLKLNTLSFGYQKKTFREKLLVLEVYLELCKTTITARFRENITGFKS